LTLKGQWNVHVECSLCREYNYSTG
jgi:hypothetical protein